jgi:LPS sulfotransferase NodH
VKAATYDFAAIERYRSGIDHEEEQWQRWFARSGQTPVRVTYEELATDYVATVRRVLAELGIEAAGLTIPPSRLKVLRNAETEEWVARYGRDAAAR